jgi:branched-chain amino acid transport system ATP-binding protein
MILEIKNLHVSYGAIKALRGISLHVDEGEIVALIGGNGAGKSTTLNTISGLIKPTEGNVFFKGEEITGKIPDLIVSRGIIQVPEGRHIFSKMSVWENLEMGAYLQKSRAEKKQDIENAFKRFPRLAERKNQLGGTLSGGEQQMLAMARALMAHPKLVLLDEPSMGLSPIMMELIFDIIHEINEQGTSILLVEQNAQMALSLAHRGYVLETGKVVLEGETDDVRNNPMVIKAYLGG